MNISELARRLHVQPQVLLELLPKMGFDIGKRAIKVDPRTAQRIIREWKLKIAELERESKLQQASAEREQRKAQQTKPIALPPLISVWEFSERLGLPVTSVMKELMRQGILATVNELIDYETASIIAQDLGFRTESQQQTSSEEVLSEAAVSAKSTTQESEESDSVVRPPVVVVMGHIDHGKTKLLDAIRKTRVVEQEHGGITQHIGAYQISVHSRPITFIDTPGHEAFLTMRARGARIADIAILVVAADDGVKPQTIEAIRIIKGAELPMMVAINKMDKPEASIEKTKKELADHGVLGEGWGGAIPMTPISAKEGRGIAELLEMILLVADLHEKTLRANPLKPARGTIIEARVDKQEGVVATILVQQGTLKKNDPIVINGTQYGKVRLMRDDRGTLLEEAPPSTPVRILGLKTAPAVGDIAEVSHRGEMLKKGGVASDRSRQLLDAFARVAHVAESDSHSIVIPLIIKADVLGSLEAILSEVQKLEHPEVGFKVVHRGLGMVTDADITRAQDTGSIVIAFNVPTLPTAAMLARQRDIFIRPYTVIYALLEDLKSDLEKKLAPEIRRVVLGTATVLKIFKHEGKHWTLGVRVEEGRFVPKDVIDIQRGKEGGRGIVLELQSGKQPVKEVGSGQECGMRVETRTEIMEGDQLQAYREEKIERTLNDN